jgi:hypothetical protein
VPPDRRRRCHAEARCGLAAAHPFILDHRDHPAPQIL